VAGDVRDVAPAHEAPVREPHTGRNHLRRRDLEAALGEALGDGRRHAGNATCARAIV
jgi:hypothetical protein